MNTCHPDGASIHRFHSAKCITRSNIGDVRWELVHDFGTGTEVTMLGSGWSPRGPDLFATLRPTSMVSPCLGVGEPVLNRSLDAGQNWEKVSIP